MASYRDAGVDLEGGERHVSNIAAAVTSTWRENVVGGFGGFAAGVEIPEGFNRPVLMMSTDGVGTKLELARRSGLWSGVGFDLVAMCVDDLAATGATPLGFVDYMAVGRLDPERDTAIVTSVAEACRATGCALLGGETAEHPGVMEPDAVDLAGAALGVVERGQELGPHRVESGDAVIGLASPNLRSNGFSLVRAVMDDTLSAEMEALLEPSVIYAPSVLRAMGTGGIHAAAHITGGGIAGNLSRALPPGLGARLDSQAWETPKIFSLVAARGIDAADMYRTFNMGIGFCLIVAREAAPTVMAAVAEHQAAVVGEVGEGEGVAIV